MADQTLKPEDKELKNFLPPDDFVPDWKHEFRAMMRADLARKLARYFVLIAVGFAAAGFIPGLFVLKGVVIGALVIAANACWIVSQGSERKAQKLNRETSSTIRVLSEEEVRVKEEFEAKLKEESEKRLVEIEARARALSDAKKIETPSPN